VRDGSFRRRTLLAVQKARQQAEAAIVMYNGRPLDFSSLDPMIARHITRQHIDRHLLDPGTEYFLLLRWLPDTLCTHIDPKLPSDGMYYKPSDALREVARI
jgi:hypothetical protein